MQRNVCKEGRRALHADQDAIARSGEGSFVCLGCIVGLERGEEASRAVVGGCSCQLPPLCGGESWAAWHLLGEQAHVETVGAFCDLDSILRVFTRLPPTNAGSSFILTRF